MDVWITPSIVLSYLFCARFIYFMYNMLIPEHQGKRFLVKKGRKIHELKKKVNPGYLRKKLGVVSKQTDVPLYSHTYFINGRIDEILFLNDNTASPIDYKFAYHKRDFNTFYFQALMYCIMIEENYHIKSPKAFICYTRDKNEIREICYSMKDRLRLEKILKSIRDIITGELFPKKTASKRKCEDCTYRKVCVQ